MDDKNRRETKGEEIILQSMDEVLRNSMLPYAEHVILERALPRVEDGLKPVQRRILYTMRELGLQPDKPHRKSARIVGDCLGKYHPHGDSSVYDAMVHMAQPFSMRVPLVDGHGNFGSDDGDGAAAMRYTEARMTEAALRLLTDIDSDTVPFVHNFDDTMTEPELLPGRFPNLLVNGATGIAVGLATNIPPHNPGEAIDAAVAVMERPDISLSELMEFLPAPDFPTGGYLLRSDEIRRAYETGRGKLTLRAKTHFEPQKNGKTLIVVTELPFQVSKAAALEKILAVTQEKKALFSAVGDIRDESDRQGTRAVIEVKKDGDPEKLLQYLYKYTDLQCTFGVNMVAIAEGKPRQLSLLELLTLYADYQKRVVTRRTKHELEAARAREHILEGYLIAIDRMDEVIALIRASKSPAEAKAGLMSVFGMSEKQAQAVLELRLQKLTNLELLDIQKEYAALMKRIAELNAILASEKKLISVVKKELLEAKALLASPRRTELIDGEAAISVNPEDMAVWENVTVAFYEGLRVRKLPVNKAAALFAGEEAPLYTVETRSDRRLRLFTDRGAILSLLPEDVPESKPGSKPVNLPSLVPFETGEKLLCVLCDSESGDYLFATAKGMVKRTPKAEYRLKAKRSAAISLKEGDSLLSVADCTEEPVLLLSRKGMCIRFAAESIPVTGRVSGGVKGMQLEAGDSVCCCLQADDEGELLLITDRGFGKRCFLFDFELQGRNGKGLKVIDWKKNNSNGYCIAGAFRVKEPCRIRLTQRHGTATTLSSESVRIENRSGKGTLLVPVILDDDVIACDISEK